MTKASLKAGFSLQSIAAVSRRIGLSRRLHYIIKITGFGPRLRADLAETLAAQPPTQLQDSASDPELDTTTVKNQRKVYRIDRYTVHWCVEADAGVKAVEMRIDGEVQCVNACVLKKNSITLSCSKLLEPSAYQPSGPGLVSATVSATDCAGQLARSAYRALRHHSASTKPLIRLLTECL